MKFLWGARRGMRGRSCSWKMPECWNLEFRSRNSVYPNMITENCWREPEVQKSSIKNICQDRPKKVLVRLTKILWCLGVKDFRHNFGSTNNSLSHFLLILDLYANTFSNGRVWTFASVRWKDWFLSENNVVTLRTVVFPRESYFFFLLYTVPTSFWKMSFQITIPPSVMSSDSPALRGAFRV